ncbi:MAG: phosphatase PAP2 family protein [Clostridia bacterium]|nr:phosphatase PAP2 family protein [Clostridia bacterium]
MNILLALQDIRNPVFDIIFKIFTTLAEQNVIIIVYCIIAWCVDKRFAYRTGFAFCIGMGINQIVKLIFCIQRPWVLDNRIKPSEYALDGATGYSFPSGHTQSGVTFMGCLFQNYKNTAFRFFCIVSMSMIPLSRMYFGVHTFWDVMISFLIGIAVLLVSQRAYAFFDKHEATAAVLGILFSFGMVAFALLKSYPEYHIAEYAYDCIKIAGAFGGFFAGWYIDKKFIDYKTDGKLAFQIIKTVLGILLLFIIKIAFKKLFEQNYFIMYLQNFVLMLWCTAIYPFVFNKKSHGN